MPSDEPSDETSASVTADDVAALAGVSRWTVNRAFKKDASISAKSRAKVMDAARHLGYAPDLLAASLASDRSGLVALLVDDFANPYKLYMIEHLTRALRHGGWGTLLVNTVDDDDTSAALLNASQRRVDAAVLIGSRYDDAVITAALGGRRVKKLIVFARLSADPDTISICCDDRSAMQAITRHVVKGGYQRPVFVAGPQTPNAHLLRKETFLQNWQKARRRKAQYTAVEAYDPQLAYQRVAAFLSELPDSRWPDILVCENDALAIGAIDAVRFEFGLSVPEDIAVTGFDDASPADNPNYKLTTYRQPIPAMAEALVSLLHGDAPAHGLREFEGELVIRTSA